MVTNYSSKWEIFTKLMQKHTVHTEYRDTANIQNNASEIDPLNNILK